MQFSKKVAMILGSLPVEQFETEGGVIETQPVFFRESTQVEGRDNFDTDFVGYLNEACLTWLEKEGNEKLFEAVNSKSNAKVEISGYLKSKSKDFNGGKIFNTRMTITRIAFPQSEKAKTGAKQTRAEKRAAEKRESTLYKASETTGNNDNDLPF